MKGQRMLIGVLILGLLLAPAVGVVLAQGPTPSPSQGEGGVGVAPLGTAFTYQGRLTDGGSPTTGLYDFEFRLYDDPTVGSQVGGTVTQDDVTVTEGLFTVLLDFGSTFTGDARYLEVAVRPGASIGAYAVLSPRQALTAAPYALYALNTAPHTHLGQTWVGSSNPLVISGTFGAPDYAPLVLGNTLASGDGLRVSAAGDDGVYVYRAGSPSATYASIQKTGFEVAGAEGDGVYVGRADDDGVHVYRVGSNGVYVDSAGNDGVLVRKVGSASATSASTEKNGFEVAGAEGNGLYVGRADVDGVHVNSAGWYGVHVSQAGWHGVYVYQAAGHGVLVSYADKHGVYVNSADWDGVHVYQAGEVGVYANTTQASHEWGFLTPDKIYAGTSLVSGGPSMIVAQNGDGSNLEPGDVVVGGGVGVAFAGSEFPAPRVQRAGKGHGAVVGVVYRRFVAEERAEEIERDGQVERRTSVHTSSTEGPIAPGDYLLLVVLGPAQVKAQAVDGDVRPGDLLTAAGDGKASLMKAGGVESYTPGTIVGTAMEPLDAARGSGLIWALVQPR